MINSYKGMKAEKTANNASLPAGGYVAQIVGARVENYSWGDVVIIAFDIIEGEYASFFKKQFDSNTSEDKKWKGTYRLTVPDERSQYFENNQRTFNNFIWAMEDSNNGYHYDCDELKFKGKIIGVLFRNKEFMGNDGSVIKCTECGGVTDVQSIRENTFRPLKDKLLSNVNQSTDNYSSSNSVNEIIDDDVPFN